MPDERLSWGMYFMKMAHLVAERSTCLRRQVGAVLVKDKRVLATGYNGAPSGAPHCDKTGCLRQQMNIPSGERHEICRALHAEQNCILQCATYGISTQGAIMYCTTFPCAICAKMIAGCGIRSIIAYEGYPDELSKTILQESKIDAHIMKGVW